MTALILPSQPAAKQEPSGGDSKAPRDGRNRPLIIPFGGGKPKAYTRTTTFIDCIEDKSALNKWDRRMTLYGATKAPRIVSEAAALDPSDPQDKARLDGMAAELVTLAGAHVKREKGTRLHDLSEYVDRGQPLPACTESELNDMMAYLLATAPFRVEHIERLVACAALEVGGTPDRVLWYDGPGPDGKHIAAHLIGDLKTGSVVYGALKMAMQLGIYSRSLFYDYTVFPVDTSSKKELAAWKKRVFTAEEAAQCYSPLPDVHQKWGVIINLPAGSGECELQWIDLEVGWEVASEVATRVRKARGRKVLHPFQSAVSQVTRGALASPGSGV